MLTRVSRAAARARDPARARRDPRRDRPAVAGRDRARGRLRGGALGLVVAHWLATADRRARARRPAADRATSRSTRTVALFTFAAVVAVALADRRDAAAAGGRREPARQRSRASGRPAGRGALRTRSSLLVAQIGLSVVLLVAAGLVVRSFMALQRVDLGFTPDRVLSADRAAAATRARPPNVWMQEFLARVRAAARRRGGGRRLPPAADARSDRPGRARCASKASPRRARPREANPTLNHQIATPGYFEAMRIPLRAGRFFTDRDTADVPRVAIVSESTARRLWPGQDPIGKRLSMSSFTPGGPRHGRGARSSAS